MGTVGVSPYDPSVAEPLPSRFPELTVRKDGCARYRAKERPPFWEASRVEPWELSLTPD